MSKGDSAYVFHDDWTGEGDDGSAGMWDRFDLSFWQNALSTAEHLDGVINSGRNHWDILFSVHWELP